MTRPKLAEVLQKWDEGKDPSSEDFQELLKAAKDMAKLQANFDPDQLQALIDGKAGILVMREEDEKITAQMLADLYVHGRTMVETRVIPIDDFEATPEPKESGDE